MDKETEQEIAWCIAEIDHDTLYVGTQYETQIRQGLDANIEKLEEYTDEHGEDAIAEIRAKVESGELQ